LVCKAIFLYISHDIKHRNTNTAMLDYNTNTDEEPSSEPRRRKLLALQSNRCEDLKDEHMLHQHPKRLIKIPTVVVASILIWFSAQSPVPRTAKHFAENFLVSKLRLCSRRKAPERDPGDYSMGGKL
jgi:hypothetical protein